MNVDVHCHVIPEECLDLHFEGPDGRDHGIRVERAAGDEPAVFFDGRELNNCRPAQLFDIDLRLREMDAAGIDVQAVSVVPFLYLYEASARAGVEFCRRLNDGITAVASGHPDRFVPLATVPLQNPTAAVEEADPSARPARHARG